MHSRSTPVAGRAHHPGRVLAATLTVALASAATALAGPPLLCHPFDIGSARSLPWDGRSSWFDVDASYALNSLVADTEALLAPSTPVIVRMETLRRAAIYAGRDAAVARQLLDRLAARAVGSAAKEPDPLALFDAGYLVEALRQLTMVPQFKAHRAALEPLVAGKDGYVMVKKSLALRPNDASLEFGAALVVADKDQRAYRSHADRARAGANGDALLAKNIRQLG
ncbi:MAG TPA: hypothetical protein PKK95_08780 [Vicinamibacterales bacterium]|nr:hypothetical protein [Vicinamibacterales bacterium]